MTPSFRSLAFILALSSPALAQQPPAPPAPQNPPPAPQNPPPGPNPLAPQAAAGTHDLRLEHRQKAGDDTTLVERVRQQGTVTVRKGDEVLQEEKNDQGYEQRYSEQVQEVDAAGKVVKASRTYSFIEVYPDQKLDMTATPVKVDFSRAGEEGPKFTPAEGAKVPELLDQLLMMEAGADGAQEAQRQNRRRLLPETPQAVGATWTIPVADAAQIFDMDPGELALDKCEVKGTFEGIEKLGDVDATRVLIHMKLAFTSFEGMPCPEPVLFDAKIRMIMPTTAEGVASSTTLEGTLKGKANFPEDSGMPPGAQLEVDIKLDNSRVVTKVAK